MGCLRLILDVLSRVDLEACLLSVSRAFCEVILRISKRDNVYSGHARGLGSPDLIRSFKKRNGMRVSRSLKVFQDSAFQV